MTNHPSFGSFKCYLGPGTYDFYMAKGGYTFETLTGLPGGGSMANQDASAVTMTTLGLNTAPNANRIINLRHDKSGHYGIWVQPVDDAGALTAMLFANAAGTAVGSIATTVAGTTYNTTSDVRLKEGVAPLADALDVVRALQPVAFRWKTDQSAGHGFLAHEVQAVVPGIVTGETGAVDVAGQIVPQQMDYSKLVPWLVAAVKELTQQVEMLTARARQRTPKGRHADVRRLGQ